jgi:hypothetical protein
MHELHAPHVCAAYPFRTPQHASTVGSFTVNDQSLALALCHDLPSDLPPGTYVATEKSTLVTQEFRVLAWKNRWEIPPQIRTGA